MVYCTGAKKGSVRERRKGSTGDVRTGRCIWGLPNCSRVLRNTVSIGALGVLLGQKLQDNLLSCDYLFWQVVLINQRNQLF